jgi:hypothetical protein
MTQPEFRPSNDSTQKAQPALLEEKETQSEVPNGDEDI